MHDPGIPGDPELAEEYLHPEDRADELLRESEVAAEHRELVHEAEEYRKSRGELGLWQRLLKKFRP